MKLDKTKVISFAIGFITNSLLIILGICLMGLWYSQFPEKKPSVEVVTTTHRIEGDVNGDREVDDKDIAIINTNWGKQNPSYGDGDLNEDGKIDALDLSVVMKNFESGKLDIKFLET